jgi:hypothetical protein
MDKNRIDANKIHRTLASCPTGNLITWIEGVARTRPLTAWGDVQVDMGLLVLWERLPVMAFQEISERIDALTQGA